MATSSTHVGTSTSGAAPFGRPWESVISYEDRGRHLATSRWRLSGIRTRQSGGNTDQGVLWLKTTRAGDTAACELYKDSGCGSSQKVASGSADVSGCDGTGENAAEVALSAESSSGITGSFRIHRYVGDGTCPVQVALCTDEDLDALFDGVEDLPGCDGVYGLAEWIRLAGEDVLGKVTAIYREQLGGHGAPEAWYIANAERVLPDLRRIANPGQLRLACAHHALELAVGRSHQGAAETMYSALRDYHGRQYDRAMASLVLAFKAGGGHNAAAHAAGSVCRMARG